MTPAVRRSIDRPPSAGSRRGAQSLASAVLKAAAVPVGPCAPCGWNVARMLVAP